MYYSDDDLKAIRDAKNYKDLLAVAEKVLNTMYCLDPLRPMAMVCGPISTGNSNPRSINLQIFTRAIDRLAEGGLLVFSQMPFEDDMERIYKSDPKLQGTRLLEEFYSPIFRSGMIRLLCFLPGWEKSTGANWEHEQAKKLEIPVVYLSESYTKD